MEIAIATEDVLTEVICEKIALELGLTVFLRLRKGGSGYLRTKLSSFVAMARQYPVVVVTDLDDVLCAPRLVSEWTRNLQLPEWFFLRVAVREVESWIMSDYESFGRFICSRIDFVPEDVADPKAKLLNLASRAPRRIREELVSSRGAIASQGVGYNATLSEFIVQSWCPRRASENSNSLRRMMDRLAELA